MNVVFSYSKRNHPRLFEIELAAQEYIRLDWSDLT